MAEVINVLELFSGVGGYHCALNELSKDSVKYSFNVKAAVDINEAANTVYKHNFQNTPLITKAIETVSEKFLRDLNTYLVVMSPPCQPFTRQGHKKDVDDQRCNGLQSVISYLERGILKPNWILLENVKGFDESEAFENYVKCLDFCGYQHRVEFLSPIDFGIPNARLRYAEI